MTAASDTPPSQSAAGPERLDYLPWERTAESIADPAHLARLRRLEDEAGARFAQGAYVAPNAAVFTERLVLGEGAWIGGYALVRGDVTLGAHTTVNPYAAISGTVRCGDGVRIASHVSIVGFNHGFEDLDVPIWRQPHESLGITIEDDVWIGANAVILDGAHIGSGVVVAAGAVVTGAVAPDTVVAGVPARPLRKRGRTGGADETARILEAVGSRAAAQWPDILARHWRGERYQSPESDGAVRDSIRHLCDAVEIAAGFGGRPHEIDAAAIVSRLQAVQDRHTGFFPDPFRAEDRTDPRPTSGLALYNILACGYALEVLGAAPLASVAGVELDAPALFDWLESQPWTASAWAAGSTVDAIGTALYFNARYFESGRTLDALFGWLHLAADRTTGLWGKPTAATGLLQPVNGFYRLTRGTYAQFGLPVPYPESAIRSVLKNYRDHNGFSGATYTACNLLDTIHPLMLCLEQTDCARADAEAVARAIVTRAPERWQEGRGFAFADGQEPGLQGTEMWLATLHLAARVLGLADHFAFVPRGIHRTRAAGMGLPRNGRN